MKRLTVICGFLIFLSFLLFFPKHALAHAKAGLMLWFYTLLPSLLPFLILSNLLLHTGILDNFMQKSQIFWRKSFGLSSQGAYAWFLAFSAAILWEPKSQQICMKNTEFPKKKPPISLPFPLIQVPPFCLHTYVPDFLTVPIW